MRPLPATTACFHLPCWVPNPVVAVVLTPVFVDGPMIKTESEGHGMPQIVPFGASTPPHHL